MPSPQPDTDCPFCTLAGPAQTLLHQGRDFYLIADHAPLAEAHILLIPRGHYPCLAALPADLDAEFLALKRRMGAFVEREFGAVTFWENGIFGQSVPHAHLHGLSWRPDTSLFFDKGIAFEWPAGLRRARAGDGAGYFVVEHDGRARLMPPDFSLSRPIILSALKAMGVDAMPDSEARRASGPPIVEALLARWRESEGPAGGASAPVS